MANQVISNTLSGQAIDFILLLPVAVSFAFPLVLFLLSLI
jgi:hypothetical protein